MHMMNHHDRYRFPSISQQSLWPPGVDASSSFSRCFAGTKRTSSEALYHQTYLGTSNTFGQSEAFYSANNLSKRPRFESTSHLPIYPQRPGETDCSHYMLTRTCRFADTCKFDHPIWVPEGGIPNWKEVPLVPLGDTLPERPGEPACPYFLKTKKCRFGFKCKFNHPKDIAKSVDASKIVDLSLLPERPYAPPCAFYVKTGICKFGESCKFHHPKDIQIPVTGQENGCAEHDASVGSFDRIMSVKPPFVPFTPASLHNTKGLPVRPGEVDCPFYLKTGSCKYGATCRYSHPERAVINISVAPGLGQAMMTSSASSMNVGLINPAALVLPTIDPRLGQAALGLGVAVYPQRPGQTECAFYMKTGDCKFGERCKYHHPIDRTAATQPMPKQDVKLTLAGLPRREGAVVCPFYMKTGACKYGSSCRFDHPPPGEAVAMATVVQGSSSAPPSGEAIAMPTVTQGSSDAAEGGEGNNNNNNNNNEGGGDHTIVPEAAISFGSTS
ncbi:zinc finger CCCH domain-containing protein 37-like isoform X1 [Papaver somniferum]|uniref:zinc finger CCCH domain-containing protein 37-like isoform X1 n=1 Tax=Papaver somniferum TaxID=3469 RepID=UPI000E702BE0|nr:zinc finger CCCH domain-containing protein 37-like isoform X1 [Papaver somniferum]